MKIPFTNFRLVRENNEPRGVINKGGQSIAGWASSYGMRIAPQDLWKIYKMSADVFSCIREWRQGVGDGGFRIASPLDHEVDANDVTKAFLNRFWQNSGGFDYVKSLALRDLGICGNAFFEIVPDIGGDVYGLKRLDPRTMYIIADKHGTIMKYVQRVAGAEDVIFDKEEVWHIVFDDDSDNELIGMSPLETAIWEARSDIAAAQSNYYFFENDAVPAHLYIMDKTMQKPQLEEAVKNIKEQFGGAQNRNKSAVMAGVEEIKTLALSQKDMEFVVGRKFNTDKVCSVFGVPKYILGYTESVNYSNGEAMLKKFYQSTLQPNEKLLANSINSQLFVKIKIETAAFHIFLPQTFGDELELRRIALSEMTSGAITLRQYKLKTGQEVTAEDEQESMIDKHIIHNGSSALLMEDVGVDPVVNPEDPETAQNLIKALETLKISNGENN